MSQCWMETTGRKYGDSPRGKSGFLPIYYLMAERTPG